MAPSPPSEACKFMRLPLSIALALACGFVADTSHAYINTPFITPTSPAAGQMLSINVDAGVCDGIISEPGYPQVSQVGGDVRIVLAALRYTDSEECILPSGVATVSFGTLPEGSYQVTVDVFYYAGFGTPTIETIGVLPLVVRAAAVGPVGAPATTPMGLAMLVTLLMGVAMSRQRKPRREKPLRSA